MAVRYSVTSSKAQNTANVKTCLITACIGNKLLTLGLYYLSALSNACIYCEGCSASGNICSYTKLHKHIHPLRNFYYHVLMPRGVWDHMTIPDLQGLTSRYFLCLLGVTWQFDIIRVQMAYSSCARMAESNCAWVGTRSQSLVYVSGWTIRCKVNKHMILCALRVYHWWIVRLSLKCVHYWLGVQLHVLRTLTWPH